MAPNPQNHKRNYSKSDLNGFEIVEKLYCVTHLYGKIIVSQ